MSLGIGCRLASWGTVSPTPERAGVAAGSIFRSLISSLMTCRCSNVRFKRGVVISSCAGDCCATDCADAAIPVDTAAAPTMAATIEPVANALISRDLVIRGPRFALAQLAVSSPVGETTLPGTRKFQSSIPGRRSKTPETTLDLPLQAVGEPAAVGAQISRNL